jgi:hypothetical protein
MRSWEGGKKQKGRRGGNGETKPLRDEEIGPIDIAVR